MDLIKPKILHPGDTLAAVTLSWGGPGTFSHRYAAGKAQLEQAFGVRVIEMPHTLSSADYLKANPQARANDLMQAFADPAVAGIVSTIGGDDSIRLIPFVDLDVISHNPKAFLGFSDTTVSHFMCLKAGLLSFYGPSVMAGFGENGGLFPYLRSSVEKTLFSSEPIGQLWPNQNGWTVEHLDWEHPEFQTQRRKLNPSTGWNFLQGSGQHNGHLLGGCIEVLDWLRGTPLWPEKEIWKGVILFLETSEEGPDPAIVQRILRAFAATGVLDGINGILFGRPGGQVSVSSFVDYDKALIDIISGELGRADLPLVSMMDFGHTDPAMVLPYGCECVIDCDKRTVTIPEGAVAAQ